MKRLSLVVLALALGSIAFAQAPAPVAPKAPVVKTVPAPKAKKAVKKAKVAHKSHKFFVQDV